MFLRDRTRTGIHFECSCHICLENTISNWIAVWDYVGHLGHDEAMEAGGREFDPRPGHYSRMSF